MKHDTSRLRRILKKLNVVASKQCEEPINGDIEIHLTEKFLEYIAQETIDSLLEEGWRPCPGDKQHMIMLHRRDDKHGGLQLHIKDLISGKQYAYRSTGDKSEPNRFRRNATNAVRKIVRRTFNLPPSTIIECKNVTDYSYEVNIVVLDNG